MYLKFVILTVHMRKGFGICMYEAKNYFRNFVYMEKDPNFAVYIKLHHRTTPSNVKFNFSFFEETNYKKNCK